ncbi:MAG: RNA polymerase sigma factor [Acidobacteriota bacterium]
MKISAIRESATAASTPAPTSASEPADLALERARRGDVGAFEVVYRRHVDRVYALCLRLCGDVQEAEEATQDAFVRAWRRLDSFRGDAAFTTWMHRLTVNTVLGRWRAAGRYRERVLALDDLVDDADADDLAPPTRPQDGLRLDLERAIARLPRGARTVFVLHDLEGLRHRDIAERTGLAVGTSKTQLHRARRLLRRFLDDSPTTRAR